MKRSRRSDRVGGQDHSRNRPASPAFPRAFSRWGQVFMANLGWFDGISRNSPHDPGTERTVDTQRQPLPNVDHSSVIRIVGAHFADCSAADVVLPDGELRLPPPLFLEP